MISKTAEYALRAVVHLATPVENPTRGIVSQTLGQIAEGTQVPSGYLSKVMQQLARAGIVNSQRGIGGGFQLSRQPNEITVYDVVQQVDPIGRIPTCPLGLASHQTALCPLHAALDAAAADLENSFRVTTIAQLCEGRKSLCAEQQTAP